MDQDIEIELNEYKNEFENLLIQVENDIKEIRQFNKDNKSIANDNLKNAKKVLRYYKLCYRELERDKQKQYSKNANFYNEQINFLEKEINGCYNSTDDIDYKLSNLITINEDNDEIISINKNNTKKTIITLEDLQCGNINEQPTLDTTENTIIQLEQMNNKIMQDLKKSNNKKKIKKKCTLN